MSYQAVDVAFRRRVRKDHASHKLVLLAIAEHAEADGTRCFAFVPEIVERTQLSDRCVRTAIRELVEDGHLLPYTVGKRRLYAVNMDVPVELSSEKVELSSDSDTDLSSAEVELCSVEVELSAAPSKPSFSHPEPPTPLRLVEPPLPSSQPSLKRRRDEEDPDFKRFWDAYPRKVAVGKARQAWVKALRRAAPEEIIEGASRYRNDPGRNPSFTAHATTWLNADRWLDEPLTPTGTSYEDRPTRYV